MAFHFTLHTEESSYLPTNMPSADGIWNALQSVRLPSGAHWVGPVAKIDRYKPAQSLSWKTAVTWVLEVPAPYAADKAQEIANHVAADVDRALGALSSDWSPVVMTPYNEAQQGPLAGWASGQSAVPSFDSTVLDQGEKAALDVQQYAARTGDQAVQFLRSSVSSIVDPINQKAGNILTLLAIGAGVVVLAVALPYALTARSVAQAARRNPTFVDRVLRAA